MGNNVVVDALRQWVSVKSICLSQATEREKFIEEVTAGGCLDTPAKALGEDPHLSSTEDRRVQHLVGE